MFDWLYRAMGVETEGDRLARERKERHERIKKDQKQYRRERLKSHFSDSYDNGSFLNIINDSSPPQNCDRGSSSHSSASNSCSGSCSSSSSSNSCSGSSSCSSSSSSCGGGGS